MVNIRESKNTYKERCNNNLNSIPLKHKNHKNQSCYVRPFGHASDTFSN